MTTDRLAALLDVLREANNVIENNYGPDPTLVYDVKRWQKFQRAVNRANDLAAAGVTVAQPAPALPPPDPRLVGTEYRPLHPAPQPAPDTLPAEVCGHIDGLLRGMIQTTWPMDRTAYEKGWNEAIHAARKKIAAALRAALEGEPR